MRKTTARPVSRQIGQGREDYVTSHQCSVCKGHWVSDHHATDFKFCPHCGREFAATIPFEDRSGRRKDLRNEAWSRNEAIRDASGVVYQVEVAYDYDGPGPFKRSDSWQYGNPTRDRRGAIDNWKLALRDPNTFAKRFRLIASIGDRRIVALGPVTVPGDEAAFLAMLDGNSDD